MKLRQQLKLILLFLPLFLTQILCAQTFREAPFPAEREGFLFGYGSIAFSDIDGDNDQDVLVTGTTGNIEGEFFSYLYTNDGLGNFTKVLEIPFDGVYYSSIAFADVDGDNDPDVLITGQTSPLGEIPFEIISKLYLNDGSGNFSEVSGTPFEGVRNGSVAFTDVDGDNDPDVFITGWTSPSGEIPYEGISKLYLNDGLGNFSEMLETPFDGVGGNSIAFADVDGDNDPDMLISGSTSWDEHTMKLYINDGLGNFSEMPPPPFDELSYSSIDFADVDGDNDPDVLITGQPSQDEYTTKLYINDGLGNFSEMLDTPFPRVSGTGGSIAFADVDGDTDLDVFISGLTGSFRCVAKLYRNDGQGNFSEITGTPFGNFHGIIAFADVDGDSDQDVLISRWLDNGTDPDPDPDEKLYLNDGFSSSIGSGSASEFNFEFVVYPNPTTPSILKVDFNLPKNDFVTTKVYDLYGKLLSEQTTLTEAGPHTITVDLVGFSAGSYYIQLEDEERKSVAKFVVVK